MAPNESEVRLYLGFIARHQQDAEVSYKVSLFTAQKNLQTGKEALTRFFAYNKLMPLELEVNSYRYENVEHPAMVFTSCVALGNLPPETTVKHLDALFQQVFLSKEGHKNKWQTEDWAHSAIQMLTKEGLLEELQADFWLVWGRGYTFANATKFGYPAVPVCNVSGQPLASEWPLPGKSTL
ncbi:uncharacterized protein FIBRA_09061 [Fibroporia radiculosa]|uniref:Uncharacterized protein n=1 Tax=Fibroporia radiculosa TaxID=599839 RepID=J4GIT2_9APHY|nr:uncharacterized protein FIBRA_09061 [Fibroporia radiculosa]CCM06763.1 predicted protein [Fibroporia radiculosa]